MKLEDKNFGQFIELFTIALNRTGYQTWDLQEIQGKFSLALDHADTFKRLSIRDLLGDEIWQMIEPSFLDATAKASNSPRDIHIPLIDMTNPVHTKALEDINNRLIEINDLRSQLGI